MRTQRKQLKLFIYSSSAFAALLVLVACDSGTSPYSADIVDTSDTADPEPDLVDTSDFDATSDLEPDSADTTDAAIDVPTTPYTDSLLLSDQFLNIAHRGGKLLAPEDTMAAFSNAVDVGADVLELDVQSSSDGVLVVIHDAEVDRTTDGTGVVHEQTFEALRQLDAGYHFTQDGGTTFPFRGQGVVIPTLEEVLTAYPEMYFIIEAKQVRPSIAEDIVALIEELEMESQVCVSSFSDIEVAAVREANPDLITAYAFVEMFNFITLTEDEVETYVPVAELMQIPPEQGNMDLLSPEFLARAHSFGLKVQVWTINSRTEMESMVQLELDGIMTDDPETLAEVIEASGVND